MRRRISKALVGAALTASLVMPQLASAFEFVPEDLEWAAWPEYCKAVYVTQFIGARSKWGREYPRSQVEYHRARLGEETFIHVHHYCAGLAWFQRAKLEPKRNARAYLLDRANEEMTYTFDRIPETSPLYPTIAANLAQVCKELGQTESAIAVMKRALKAQPKDPRPYLGLSVLYRDLGRSDLAREILLEGNEALAGDSIEIHYNLGLLYAEAREYDLAVEHAKKAYEGGYPLPGLADKLRRAGRWQD
jgi:Flp pilus assembly protein TadD